MDAFSGKHPAFLLDTIPGIGKMGKTPWSSSMSKPVRSRFAPSPTGLLHLGGLRTALYNYILARQTGGQFILRIEDTDRNRFVPGAMENLINSLKIMGIEYDEGPLKGGPFAPYLQSERLDIYREHVAQLVAKGAAYPCFCSAERLDEVRTRQQAAKENFRYDGHCRNLDPAEAAARIAAGESHVIRLKMPQQGSFTCVDALRGSVEIDASLVDDQVLMKSDGFPTYHLACMVDDHIMGVTHVLRGEEWLPSTPKHVFIYESFGWEQPIWVHLPLLLSKDGGKLSKRHGDFSVEHFLEKGYVKEALLNFVALLGWHPSSDQELYTIPEIIEQFSFDRLNKAGAVFDLTKLDWMNGHYLRTLPLESITDQSLRFFEKAGLPIDDRDKLMKVVATSRERIAYLEEITEHASLYWGEPQLSEADAASLKEPAAQSVLTYFLQKLESLGTWNKDDIPAIVQGGIDTLGIKGKHYYTPLRLALLGAAHGPDIPTIIDNLGPELTLSRLRGALLA
jgi:glutamyl-tRNA synthetase